MTEAVKPPAYMAHLLEALGWNQGTRIPLADSANKELESILIERQTELQRLKEALTLQKQKREDLNNYKLHVQTEYQENTRLLFAHKQQMEQEVKLLQLCTNEADRLDRDVLDCNKQSKDIQARIDRLQNMITKYLKKADSMKSEVCGERGALAEWRGALERSACDITAIEQFTKQDLSKAKALETKRQKLKLEHDRMHERLVQLVSNLSAEERACDRISIQVMEGMEERKQMMSMWTAAVENLRQRDKDIRHIREDYAVLETEANNLAEQCREQQAFCDQQRGNNNDAKLENMALAAELGQIRISHQQLIEINITLDSEAKSLQRELSNMQNCLEKLHAENRNIMNEQHRKDLALKAIDSKLRELKKKLMDSMDKTKSSEKRAKELEDILNEEERYASQVTTNQQRAMHCSFVEQQKLQTLQNEEKLFYMQLKSSKAICSKLDSKNRGMQRLLQTQKEALYNVCYQVETIGARVSHMEGAQAERECSAVLVSKENRMKSVYARHAARVSLLERHSAKLHDDMRRLAREVETKSTEHTNLQSRLKTAMLNVEGGEKELASSRDAWRRSRVEEALMRLRVAHATRALSGLDDTAFNLDEQRLHIDAAMNERLVEIKARREMFNVQKRALFEECGKLRCEIREREQRIDQLIKRYSIFVDSLGKDESGQQLSVTYFKIKFAAERAELRERGASLDVDISRCERDVAALEATLRVVAAAHQHFMRHISPVSEDSPEMAELNGLRNQFYELRSELQSLQGNIGRLEQYIRDAESRLTTSVDKTKQLEIKKVETEQELETARDRMERQQVHLQHARDILNHNAKRAMKLVDGVDEWRIFQLVLWNRDFSEAAHTAVVSLCELANNSPEITARFSALIARTDLKQHVPKNMRRLQILLQKIVTDTQSISKKEPAVELEESVFSSSASSTKSGVSIASGYTQRLCGFRRQLAPKVQEDALIADIPEEARRSTVSLRVITLALESSSMLTSGAPCGPASRRSLLK
ncbi:coiled-coil domain-containing protein 39 [Spodoptera frugiperda]|uniref:Coiled-coil domain-containing protein 39 n=1 Tax=Spodoptera frugiperda TaxID=7108 RepID=A0A9R0CUS6_SPOFR|nr:coiled-coil domain-containing protein 39 [Spodoptera frugiperda]